MRIYAQKERSVNLFLLAIEANSLGDSQDVPLVKRTIKG